MGAPHCGAKERRLSTGIIERRDLSFGRASGCRSGIRILLLKLVGDESAGRVLREGLSRALSREDLQELRSLGQIFHDEERVDEFEEIVRSSRRFPPSIIEELIDGIRRPTRLPRFMRR